LSPPLLAT